MTVEFTLDRVDFVALNPESFRVKGVPYYDFKVRNANVDESGFLD